ncbi:hypothetical protein VTK73DRAFT_1445 [Phialemonium thermophilum]|uniref:Uncharacterized protein n=1 Tax=Phialemonium thermophilum TaxID=223376 RepID=A0ABR3VTG5_9PEZI
MECGGLRRGSFFRLRAVLRVVVLVILGFDAWNGLHRRPVVVLVVVVVVMTASSVLPQGAVWIVAARGRIRWFGALLLRVFPLGDGFEGSVGSLGLRGLPSLVLPLLVVRQSLVDPVLLLRPLVLALLVAAHRGHGVLCRVRSAVRPLGCLLLDVGHGAECSSSVCL